VVDCDDNECTTDLCDTDSGFYYTAVDCDDSSACTFVILKMDATKLLLLTHVMIISVVKIRKLTVMIIVNVLQILAVQMDANMLMLYVMIITHVQKIPVTMKLDVLH